MNQPPVLDQTSVIDLPTRDRGPAHLDRAGGCRVAGPRLLAARLGPAARARTAHEPEAYVVDHFSSAGSRAVFDFWDGAVLTPEIRSLLQDSGGNIFEDSLEVETEATLWTATLPSSSGATGYDLFAYLAGILQVKEKYSSSSTPRPPTGSASTSARS